MKSFISKFLLFCFTVLFTSCATNGIRVYDGLSKATRYVSYTTCVERDPVEIRLRGFRYTVPEDMFESENAHIMRYDNLLLDKGFSYMSSPVVIAIRHKDSDYGIKHFVQTDQQLLRQSHKIAYDRPWEPPSFEDKNIEYMSFEFSYMMSGIKIYQRSVYVKDRKRYYIISMSTLDKRLLSRNQSTEFWESVFVD